MSDWPTVSAPAEAWSHLDTQVLSVAAATITFSGIAATAAPRLRLYVYLVKDGSAGQARLRFNNDSGTTYANQRLLVEDVNVTGLRQTGQTEIIVLLTGSATGANEPAILVATVEKPVAGEVGRVVLREAAIDSVGSIRLGQTAGEWTNTGALINRVDFVATTGNFDAGSRFVLEGAA